MNMYDRMRAMVIRNLSLLEQGGHGSELLISRTVTTHTPGTGTVTKVTTVYKTTALRNNYRNFDLTNSSIKETDVNFYVSPVATTEILDPEWSPLYAGDERWYAGDPEAPVNETEEDRPLIDVGVDTPEPTTVDKLEFLGNKYTVVNVRPWNHAGVSIGFKVQGRVAA